MAYCTTTDVAAEFKSLTLSATSTPTDTEVTEFIAQEDAFIDGSIADKYSVPVSSSDSPIAFKILKKISILLTAGRIMRITRVKDFSREDLKQEGMGADPRLEGLAMLKSIREGKLKLRDATYADASDGMGSFAVDEDEEFTFEKNVDQW